MTYINNWLTNCLQRRGIAKKDYQLSEIYEMLYNYRRTIEMYKGEKDGDRVDL